jgi:O-antigen/teichoic acid export membrane protein
MSASESTPQHDTSGHLVQEFGRRIGRDTIVYAAGTCGVLAVSVVTLAVFTHYMSPSEYGRLSVLFFAAGSLTILLNLIPLAGILRWVYVSGEADAGAIDDPSRQAPGGTKRRALGTGAWMNAVSIAVGSAILIPLRGPLGHLLLGASPNQVLLAISSGASGSIFRVATNVVRMERRPVAFSVLTAARSAVSLAVAVPLVATHHGIDGALIGTIAGSLAPSVVAFATTRTSYSAEFNWHDAHQITNLGFRYVLVIIGLFIVHNSDSFVLSRFASAASVGIYRVATRLSSIISYLVSAFLLAWAPLERSQLFQTTYERHGMARMHSRMLTYFVISGLTVMLGLGLAGDLIVRLSPPAYRSAADLIPFASFAFVVYGAFVIIARTTAHKHRDFVHNWGVALGAAIYLGLSALLVPRWGGYGIAISASIGMAVASVTFRLLVPTATQYAELEWPRLLGAGVISIGCLALGRSLPVGESWGRAGLCLAVFFLLYPALMMWVGVVSRTEAEILGQIARGVGAQVMAPLRPRRSGAPTAAALTELDGRDVALLNALIKQRTAPAALAAREGVALSVLEARAARALRRITGAVGHERDDASIGHWLFDVEGSAERDAIANFLVEHGVQRLTLHLVESAAAALKALPERMWPDPGSPTGSAGAQDVTTALDLTPTLGIG